MLLLSSAFPRFVTTRGQPEPTCLQEPQLVMITADPDQAARAPMGDAIVGDPAGAMDALLPLIKPANRETSSKSTQAINAPPTGPEMTVRQVIKVLAQVCPAGTAFTSEPPSLGSWWEQVPITQPRSFYCGAGGALGFALPAAVGVSLADEKRPVVALIGHGSANYSITGLWTAARLKLPCTFVIIRNGVYEVLKDYGNFLGTEGVPGMDLPGLDFVSLAAGYGLPRPPSNQPKRLLPIPSEPRFQAALLLCSRLEVEPANSGMFEK